MAGDKYFNISMTGDKELERKLKKIEFAMQRKIVKAGIRKGALIVKAAAKANAPVLTGKLKKFIHIKSFSYKGFLFGARIQGGTREQMGIDPKDKWYYPAIVEYTSRPFLRPAIDSNRQAVLDRIAAEIRRGIAAV